MVIEIYDNFSAHSSRTKSERIRNEADTLMANCASKTQRSQQEANNRYNVFLLCLSNYLSIYLAIYLTICMYLPSAASPKTDTTDCSTINLSIYLTSIYLPIYVSIYLSIYLSLYKNSSI